MVPSSWRFLLQRGPAPAQILLPTGTNSSHVKYATFHTRTVLPGTTRRYTRFAKEPVLTFRPEKFTSVGQNVIDLSGIGNIAVNVRQPSGLPGHAPSAHLNYGTKGSTVFKFPPQTRGVLYFHQPPTDSTEQQVRFRLCETVDDFQQGTDLLIPDGSPWHIPFIRLQKLPWRHAAFLSLLQEEYSLTVDRNLAANRLVSTLNPRKLLAHNQRIFDISGVSLALVLAGDQSRHTCLSYRHVRNEGIVKRDKFPAHTTGVFYYKQSVTAPTQIGELRFRLCTNALSFGQGRDLCLPSGETWNVSSKAIHSAERFKHLKALLLEEGLLDPTFHAGFGALSSRPETVVFSSLSEAFVVDFSKEVMLFAFFDAERRIHEMHHRHFRNPRERSHPLYQGRAIVRFEPYIPTTMGDGAGISKSNPLLVMRILELLTPITKLSQDDYMQPPVAGELVTINHRGEGLYVPLTFGATRRPSTAKALCDLIKSSAS